MVVTQNGHAVAFRLKRNSLCFYCDSKGISPLGLWTKGIIPDGCDSKGTVHVGSDWKVAVPGGCTLNGVVPFG